jgi:hypothetical protein
MIELVLSVCSIVSGAHCRDVSIVFSDVSLMQCQVGMAAMGEVAKWANEHPNWRVHKYHCQVPGTFAKL